jgi:methyl-accepting chemotaxis protein
VRERLNAARAQLTRERFSFPGEAHCKVVLKSADDLRENNPMQNLDNQTIMLGFVGVTALAVLLQAIILLAILITMRKAARSLKEEAEDLRSAVMPIIENTRTLLTRVAPKMESTVTDVAAVAHRLREQTEVMESTAKEIIDRVRHQSSRVDTMLSKVLDAVDRAGGFLTDAVSKPARQLAGILSSAKAVIESLRASEFGPRETRPPEDEDPFV